MRKKGGNGKMKYSAVCLFSRARAAGMGAGLLLLPSSLSCGLLLSSCVSFRSVEERLKEDFVRESFSSAESGGTFSPRNVYYDVVRREDGAVVITIRKRSSFRWKTLPAQRFPSVYPLPAPNPYHPPGPVWGVPDPVMFSPPGADPVWD